MDKAVFRSFESVWDQEFLDFLLTQSKGLNKIKTPLNITDIYLFHADVIPEYTFAPSVITAINPS